MGALANKRIVLGVAGGIAAYKSADLVRRLRDAGAEVQVVMTRAATRFITPLTLQALSGRPVRGPAFDREAEGGMAHIALARWADLVLVAPASADLLARLVQGRADDLLCALCLAAEGPVVVAPAMNRSMWMHPATQANVATLQRRGVLRLGPAEGAQACGEEGPGRMLEPAELVQRTAAVFATGVLAGRRVVVTAGPTWEPIDPVRGLTNRSSGKMGYAVAEAAAEAGARVVLISGPCALADPERVHTVRVTTACEMLDAVLAHVEGADVFVSVAAVSDYRPARAAARKLKNQGPRRRLELVRNPDILAAVAARDPAPFTVGFAAETERIERNARTKLVEKGVDLIAANRVGAPGVGFEAEENELILVDRHGTKHLPRAPKGRLARALVAEIAARLHAKDTAQDTRRAHRQ